MYIYFYMGNVVEIFFAQKNNLLMIVSYLFTETCSLKPFDTLIIKTAPAWADAELEYRQEGCIVISYAPLFKTMKEKHITSYRLEKMGFSRATYYSIQKGNSVSTNTINQLCKLLKCNVTDVMEYIEDEEE